MEAWNTHGFQTVELHNTLARHRMMNGNPVYVFTDPETGEPYRARQHFMENLCKRAKVKPFGFHAIRHLSATILAHDPEMDIPSVQAVLRHKTPNTTARYIKSLGVQPDKLDRVFAKRQRLESPTLRAFARSDWHMIWHTANRYTKKPLRFCS